MRFGIKILSVLAGEMGCFIFFFFFFFGGGGLKGAKTPTMYMPMDIKFTGHLGVRMGVMRIKGTTLSLKRWLLHL